MHSGPSLAAARNRGAGTGFHDASLVRFSGGDEATFSIGVSGSSHSVRLDCSAKWLCLAAISRARGGLNSNSFRVTYEADAGCVYVDSLIFSCQPSSKIGVASIAPSFMFSTQQDHSVRTSSSCAYLSRSG